jgi:hypothetical protein
MQAGASVLPLLAAARARLYSFIVFMADWGAVAACGLQQRLDAAGKARQAQQQQACIESIMACIALYSHAHSSWFKDGLRTLLLIAF